MRAKILAGSWNERRQSFVGSFGGDELAPRRCCWRRAGLVTPDDARFRATVDAAGEGLGALATTFTVIGTLMILGRPERHSPSVHSGMSTRWQSSAR